MKQKRQRRAMPIAHTAVRWEAYRFPLRPLRIWRMASAALLGLSLAMMGCRSHSRGALLLQFVEGGTGPLYLFTDPDRSTADPFAVRNMILRAIDGATSSMDFWFYEFDDPALKQALLRARDRGVRLTLTGSPDQDYGELKQAGLTPAIRARTGIQHAKLLLIDRRTLISGTGNFTRSCMFYNDNVYFRTTVDEVTADRILKAMIDEDHFHPPVEWQDGLARFRFLVSPHAGRTIQSSLVQSVLEARFSVRFLIFSFTDPVLAGAMIERARDGVLMEGIFESYGAAQPEAGSVLDQMNSVAGGAPLFLYADGNNHVYYDDAGVMHGGKVHHKTLIIDDRKILTGSFNWSTNARDSNLEAFYEIDDPLAPPLFRSAFERIRGASVIVARPLAAPSPLPPMDWNGSRCPAGAPFHSLTFHTGHGAFFRGLTFTPDDCSLPASASAGFQSSNLFSPGMPRSGNLLVDFRPGNFLASDDPGPPEPPAPFACNDPSCDPCARHRCRALPLQRISFSGGWALTDPGSAPAGRHDLWIWHRNGIEHHPAQMIDNELLTFEKPAASLSGAILFLAGEDGIIRIGCAFAAPPAAPDTFLNALPWFYPDSFDGGIKCISPD